MIALTDLTNLWSSNRCADSPFKLLGVRGALEPPETPNSDAIYDDLIFVIDQKAGLFTNWLASVDPSQPLISDPINPAGAAQLVTGVHLFKRGIHKENPNWPCLVQAEDFTVNRLNANGNVTRQESGDFGIHLHSGGEGESTGRFSAGCQIIHNGFGYFADPTWSLFIKSRVYAPMNGYQLSIVPYLLINAADANLDFSGIIFENPVF